MAPSKMKLRGRKREGGAKSSRRLLANASPDSKCPICLDGFNNVASLDRCLHQFCFRCIREWSKNKAECPLCKQPFHSIFHSVRGEDHFKEFVLPPVENGGGANHADPPQQRVLRPRGLRSRSRRGRAEPQAAPPPSPPPVDALVFDAVLAESREVEQMVLRLTTHMPGRSEGRSLRRLRCRDVVAFRRALYRTGVRVRDPRDGGRQRDVSASFLRQNPACLRRLLPWLQRELTVLYGSRGSLVSIVQNIVISRIMNYDMEDSAIRDELRPFLLARTDHFLHELVSFAGSSLNMEAYDQQAVYECPAPSYEEGSTSDSSVIAISEDDDGSGEFNGGDNPSAALERLQSVAGGSGTESLLSQSGWDDETPGPSHSTLNPSSSQSLCEEADPSSAPPLSSQEACEAEVAGSRSDAAGGGGEEEEEECLIVGYVKPMAERTPELVQLSSDSSEEEGEGEAAKVTQLSQSHVTPPAPATPPRSPHCSAPQAQPPHSAVGAGHWSSVSPPYSSEASPSPQSHARSATPVRKSLSWSPSHWRRVRESRDAAPPTLRPHSSSSSDADTPGQRSRPDKPGGKRKYKTRHLERAAARDKRRRSPSVEIVYERRPDSHWHPRRRKRHHRRRRPRLSPTVITIDSDSASDHAPPVIPASLEVLSHAHSKLHPAGDSAPPRPSDSRLLESILQDLEAFLPGAEPDTPTSASPPGVR